MATGDNSDSDMPELLEQDAVPEVPVKIMFAGRDIVADFEQDVVRFLDKETFYPNMTTTVSQQFEAALRSVADLMERIATNPPTSSFDKIQLFRHIKVQSALMVKIGNLMCGKHVSTR